MTKKNTGYQINEKDIKATLKYLKLNGEPEATREDAIQYLEEHQVMAHVAAHKIVEDEQSRKIGSVGINQNTRPQIKALVFDLDGTAIPNDPEGKPSEKVISVVKRAQEQVSVSIATGRPITNSAYIFEMLGIVAPSVIAGGTQVYNPQTKDILWEKDISQSTVKKIIELMEPYEYSIYISDSLEMKPASKIEITQDERVIYLMTISVSDTEVILEKLAELSEITAHKVKSWTQGCFDIHITHKEATKKNAMQELLTILGVSREEVMVVGDSDNDLPLFESAGLRVAMDNGSNLLKQQADFVTKSVDEDGLAVAIEKYILS